MRRIVITGASSGIGAVLARRLVAMGDQVIGLSRRPAAAGRWIETDLADSAGLSGAVAAIGGAPLDALVHVAGIWEADAFSQNYDFSTRPETETRAIMEVNLTAPILLTQALIPVLSRTDVRPGGQVIFVGSTSGLDNIGLPEVAYNASKAGLRAAAQAMAIGFARRGIRVTMINPDDVSPEPDSTVRGLAAADLCAAIEMILGLSAQTVVTEMTLFPGPA